MCNSLELMRWEIDCINTILNLKYTSLELIIMNDGGINSSKFIKLKKLVLSLYRKYLFNPKAVSRYDASDIFDGVNTIKCKTYKKGKHSEYFTNGDVKIIKSCGLDFILKFGFGITRGQILKSAEYGVWSFHHDDEKKYRGVPPCFWEIYYNDEITAAILQRLNDTLDGGVVLRKGFMKTVRHSYSKNIEQVFTESSFWPAQVCKDIYNNNCNYFNNKPTGGTAPIYKDPTNIQMVWFLSKLFYFQIINIFRSLIFIEKWDIGVINKGKKDLFTCGNINDFKIDYFNINGHDKLKFAADPFGIKENGNTVILYEDYDYAKDKAHISYFKIDAENKITEKGISIKESCHLSYPYIIADGKEVYCIPESHQVQQIILYKALDFPQKIIKKTILLENIQAVDPTIIKYNNKFWLMCTDESRNPEVNLFIFFSDNLFGSWSPHKQNPVKCDVRSSRPAGTPFIIDEQLIRPAQDCSKTYGGRIVLNKINKLTEDYFHETEFAIIEPHDDGGYNKGCHTLSIVGDKLFIDGRRNVFKINIKQFKIFTGALCRKLGIIKFSMPKI